MIIFLLLHNSFYLILRLIDCKNNLLIKEISKIDDILSYQFQKNENLIEILNEEENSYERYVKDMIQTEILNSQ